MAGERELVGAHDLRVDVSQVLHLGEALAEPAEQVIEVEIVLADRERAQVAIDLAGFQEGRTRPCRAEGIAGACGGDVVGAVGTLLPRLYGGGILSGPIIARRYASL